MALSQSESIILPMGILIILILYIVLNFSAYNPLGCWEQTSNTAIPLIEGSDPRIEGDYKLRTNAIRKCYQVARQRHMVVFAIKDGGMCFASADLDGHQRHKKSKECRNRWSKGTSRAKNVYSITNIIKPQGLLTSFEGNFEN